MIGKNKTCIKSALHLFSFYFFSASLHVKAVDNEPYFLVRPRLVSVDENDNSGRAASVLLRAGLESSWSGSLKSIVEVDHVSSAWRDDHNNGVSINDKPFIPDVDGSEINQLFFSYRQAENIFYIGRRRIELDDQRFIGSNSFWQNDQTFDGLAFERNFLSASSIQYYYIANANRIFGDDSGKNLTVGDLGDSVNNGLRPTPLLGDHEHKTHLLHAVFREWDYHELTSFLYYIDNIDAPSDSNKMAGFRYRFEKHFGAIKPVLTVSQALQRRLNSEQSRTVAYTLIDAGFGLRSLVLNVRYEHLEGDNKQAFITPLGSLHNFHGWADKLNYLPESGLLDRSFRMIWRKKPWKFDARFHWFESSDGGIDWGREFDLDVILKPALRHKLLLRYADYRSARVSRARFQDEKRTFFSYSYEF